MPTQAKGWGTDAADLPLKPMQFERRDLRPDDVAIRISHAGICHSDLHMARNDWGMSRFPMVPGHEIVGTVTDLGSKVSRHKVGDKVAIGCIVDSCKQCAPCQAGTEQFCEQGMTMTYGAVDKHDGTLTQGGYSNHVVCRDEYVLKLPDSLDVARAAPLLCAGITTYSPLRKFGVGKDSKVAVVGLGGLGHMGVKLAHAMGAHVTMVTTSPDKGADARELGAHDVLQSTDGEAMAEAAGRFDFILDTIPVAHDLHPYLALLTPNGTLVMVGAIAPLPSIHGGSLIMGNKTLAGSLIGGIPETQEMLDFCAEHGVHPDCEFIEISEVNEAYERLLKNDVRYRFVIDMGVPA